MNIRHGVLVIALSAGLLGSVFPLRAEGRRRAVLVGINDYSASRLGANQRLVTEWRDWEDLGGAVADVQIMAELLVLLYGFDRRDIAILTDQEATRVSIIRTIESHLIETAAPGDVHLFYFAGHGSQVRNSRSPEPDKFDETLVPADSRAGERDIHDKHLRALFNQVLDRGARLTVVLDSCHSASGARGLPTGAHQRGIKPDYRDIADPSTGGPPPEDRGGLIIAAAEDFERAGEEMDEQGRLRGAFSLAWARALRDASGGEPAIETFLRAQARLRAGTPYQNPVIAGNAEARLQPFLGMRTDRRGDHAVVAIRRIREDGTVILQGGWANGLTVGSELRVMGTTSAPRLTITAITGLSESYARLLSDPGSAEPAVENGTLLEVVGWAAPPSRPLRVLVPRSPASVNSLAALAASLAREAKRRDIRSIADPIEKTPKHTLRWQANGWELLGPGGQILRFGDNAAAALEKIPAKSSLFVQLPAPAALVDAIGIAGDGRDGVKVVTRPDMADYILVGRFVARKLEYAWVRPSVKKSDERTTGLPLRSTWRQQNGVRTSMKERAVVLRDAALRLRKIHAWHFLESPPEGRSPYRLAIRQARDQGVVRGGVVGDESYGLALRAAAPLPAHVPPRYMYAFTIDSHGKSVLLFPRGSSGSVENRFPLTPRPGDAVLPPPEEIPLGPASLFEAAPPYGVDTYFLLTCDEPLPNPWILEWDGVRTRAPDVKTPLEQLLAWTGEESRSVVVTPSNWSIERVICESTPRRRVLR